MTLDEKMDLVIAQCSQKLPLPYWDGPISMAWEGGLWMEFGVYQGTTLRKLAGKTKQMVYGFDSFDGIPEPWNGKPVGWLSLNGESPNFKEPNIRIIQGKFQDTLVDFLKGHGDPVSFLHIDCDTYASTDFVLRHLESRIQKGTIICFDELLGFPDCRHEELKAWAEYLIRNEREVTALAKQRDEYGCLRVGFGVL